MKPTSLVWISTDDGATIDPVLSALNDLGVGARSCLPGESLQHAGDLRVLQADAFAGPDELHGEYLSDPRPTLVLASSDEQEFRVLPFLSDHDEVAPFTLRADVLALRLARLARRAEQARQAVPAQTDTLTGLPTRERFEAELEHCLATLRPEQHLALLSLDLDHFGQVNETHGRVGGDLVLVQLAMVLGSELAPGDKLGHLGADKFVCLLSRYDRATLLADARLLLQRIAEQRFVVDGQAEDGSSSSAVRLSASAGLSYLTPGVPLAELWRRLDVALFDAKTQGRNRVAVYAEPAGIRPLGSSPEEQAQLQHLLNVTKVVSERVDQLLKPPSASEAALRDSYLDPLTGLNNRRYFDLRLEREFGSARKHGRPLSIAWMNIDHLHAFNRRHGWIAGDKALKAFADQALGSIRLVDWLARCSGQEFCLVMPDTDLQEGRRVAERIRTRLEACAVAGPDGQALKLGLSLGVAQIDDRMQQAEQLIQSAAEALRLAKAEPAA